MRYINDPSVEASLRMYKRQCQSYVFLGCLMYSMGKLTTKVTCRDIVCSVQVWDGLRQSPATCASCIGSWVDLPEGHSNWAMFAQAVGWGKGVLARWVWG